MNDYYRPLHKIWQPPAEERQPINNEPFERWLHRASWDLSEQVKTMFNKESIESYCRFCRVSKKGLSCLNSK